MIKDISATLSKKELRNSSANVAFSLFFEKEAKGFTANLIGNLCKVVNLFQMI